MNETNEEPEPKRYPMKIYFRGMLPEHCPSYSVSAETLAAISADWMRSRAATPLAAAIERDPNFQVYQVWQYNQQRPLMFRFEDVLFIG